MTSNNFPIKKLTIMAALTAAALIIFIIEAQFPLPIAVPGAKLGLSNVITLFALFYSRRASGETAVKLNNIDALMILIVRIILGAMFTGSALSLALSFGGGMVGFLTQVLSKKIVSDKQIWVCGAVGGVFHNVGQIFTAMLITGTPAIITYLPVLVIIGVISGVMTGLIAQTALSKINADTPFSK